MNIKYARLQQLSIALLTLALCAVSVINANNVSLWLSNLLTYAAGIGIIACGMTFVMIGGGFDLSVGSTTAVCGVVSVLVMQKLGAMPPGANILLAVLATLAAGIILGAINGILIAYVGANPFVVTLSSMFVFRGLGLVLTGGGQTLSVPLNLAESFRLVYWGGWDVARLHISTGVLIFAIVFAVGACLLYLTWVGRYVYATGGNAEASWLAGVNTRRITTITYVISGLTCAIAGVIWTSLSSTAQAASYQGTEMIVIASVVVGGTPLGGGRGGLFATLGGLLFLCVVEKLLTQFGVDPQYRMIMTGLIIVTVVSIDASLKRR